MTDITDAVPRLQAMNDALENARLRLTDEEREAVEWAANAADPYYTGHTATLRGLLNRTKDGGK